MDAPVVTNNDTGTPRTEDESEVEIQENTPSVRQEVNKPSDDDAEPGLTLKCDKTIETETENNVSYTKMDSQKGSPNKKMRKVVFPVEPVHSYLDPPDPWRNVPKWKTEDLLKAYKLGCERHGTKPLNKIVQQLSCIDNVGERYEILSLKGERLDIKQCESLEDIFKHVRFRCIDLEATHLDDETAVAIFEMVEYYESACKVNISFNKNIGGRGWGACAKLIRKTPCVTFIDAKNCDLNERVMPILGRSLRMGCYLTRLHLQSVGLAGRALVILVAALKMNEVLKELFIGDNKLMSTDGVQVGNLLKFNHKLELLDLRNNHLQDVGVHHICEGLAEQKYGSGLLTLVLWNNQISFQAMSDISQALKKTESLETLNLGHNPITNEGIHLVKDGLLKSKSLLKLGLSGTKVSCEGAVALAEVIADTARLVRLDLQENDIKTAGLMALSLALKVNNSLSRLDLDKDTKKEQGIKDYAEQQKRLQQDIRTYLERNRDLAHKQLKEKETAAKAESKILDQDQAKPKHEENTVTQVEHKLRSGDGDLTNAEKDLLSDENVYIPSEDKINRPKLLFLTENSPERDLESPACVQENISLLHPLQSVHQSDVASLTLQPASGQDLLSPQYCPKMTAKKLFSVTRVTSPTLVPSTNPLLDSTNQSLPVSHICTPLSSVPVNSPLVSSLTIETLNLDRSSQVAVDACLIQQKLETETLEAYIQDILETDIGSQELDTEVESYIQNNAEPENSSLGLETGDKNTNTESNSVSEKKIDAKMNELSCKTAPVVGKLSAGDGPVKDTDLVSKGDNIVDMQASEIFSKTEVCDENNSASILLTKNESLKSSEVLMTSNNLASEIRNTEAETAFAQSEESKLTSNYVQCKVDSQKLTKGNTIPSDLSDAATLDRDLENKVFEESCEEGSDTHGVPVSLCSDTSDNQLDSIEIIPESDISEIKLDSDLSEELPELIDCDSNDDISNTKYCGLTDSLCDMILPFELENNNITEDAKPVDSVLGESSDKNAKTFKEINADPSNSRTNGHHHRGSEIGEYESEQWNKVEKSDICDKLADQGTSLNIVKPDFHTSLSLNGLKQELASLIDEDGNPTKIGSQTVAKPSVNQEPLASRIPKDGENITEMFSVGSEVQANGD